MASLSDRLLAIASFIEKGESVADIGSDHAFLAKYIVERDGGGESVAEEVAGAEEVAVYRNSNSVKVIMTDVNPGPLARAMGTFGIEGGEGAVPSFLSFRLGDGLRPLRKGETDAVVIAGMGGDLMVRMLSEDVEKTASFGKFILQPRTRSDRLRKWIADNGFFIAEEDLAVERGRICEVIVMAVGKDSLGVEGDIPEIVKYEASAALLRRRPPLLGEFLRRKIGAEEKVLAGAGTGSGGAARDRAALARAKIDAYQELLRYDMMLS